MGIFINSAVALGLAKWNFAVGLSDVERIFAAFAVSYLVQAQQALSPDL